jgi:hypothetical protein
MARKGRGGRITRLVTDEDEKEFQEPGIEGTKTTESKPKLKKGDCDHATK